MTRQDRLGLSLVVEPGDARLRDLLTEHEPGEVLAAILGRHRLSGVRVPEAWVERARDFEATLETAATRARAAGLRWVAPGDKEWPDGLAALDHLDPWHGTTGAPLGLWVRGAGRLDELCRRSLAVVGARDCTTYGAECTSDIAADCADAGWTIVSGGAFGVDGCAHRGALVTDKPTVAVLACGADLDYPAAHAALLARVAEVGLVVSEQAPGERPLKNRFLSRNRIIAGLTQGVVVIEAALRSGSLNTLHWADQLGRVTMALPGPVTSRQSGGTHAALRDGKAVLVTGGADVVQELSGLGVESTRPVAESTTAFDRLPAAARRTLDALDWGTPSTVPQLAAAARLSVRDVRASLAVLEAGDHVVRSGSTWLLARRADLG